jgi:hypothetical protein
VLFFVCNDLFDYFRKGFGAPVTDGLAPDLEDIDIREKALLRRYF